MNAKIITLKQARAAINKARKTNDKQYLTEALILIRLAELES